MKTIYMVYSYEKMYDSKKHFIKSSRVLLGAFESKTMAINRANDYAKFVIKRNDYTADFIELKDFDSYERIRLGEHKLYFNDDEPDEFVVFKEELELETEVLHEKWEERLET